MSDINDNGSQESQDEGSDDNFFIQAVDRDIDGLWIDTPPGSPLP